MTDRDAGLGLLRQLWRFRRYARGQLRSLLLGVLMRAGELVADLATPWPLALVIDHVVRGSGPGGITGSVAHLFGPDRVAVLGVAAAAVLVVTAASGMFDYLGDRIMNGAGERITSQIRADVFAHMQRLPVGYHDKQATGELTSRIAIDTDRIEDGLVDLFSTLVPGVLSIAGFAAVLLAVDWRLGLVALSCAPGVFFTAARYSRLTRVSARRRRAAEGRMAGLVAESLNGIRTVHAFGRHQLHDERFTRTNTDVLSAGLRAVDLRARFTPLLEGVTALGTAALLFLGGYGVLKGWWSTGMLVVVTSYLKDMLKPLRSMSRLSMTFTQGAASAERVAAILDQHRRKVSRRGRLPDRIEGSVQLREVSLDYGRGWVLDHFDLTIGAGERLALLGPNGAGKSTILALITGLYPANRGEVLLGGIPLSRIPDERLHRQVSVVLQDTFLFSGTVADNIRYGRPDASPDEVRRAADAALVIDFAQDLPDGLDTALSEGGIGLSGGQRQRVGIARALLVDTPVVLLDEPTSGLDAEAEKVVVRALERLVRGRTVIMTTHRPAVTELATRTLHLEHGTLVEPAEPDRAPVSTDGAGLPR